MSGRRYIFFMLLYAYASVLPAQWPANLGNLKQGMCLVEYFQSLTQTREIRDDARTKRKITGILVNRSGLVIVSDLIYPVSLDIVGADFSYSRSQKPPEDITVSFSREKKLKAQFIGKDEELHLAFIQITELDSLPAPVTFLDQKKIKPGDPLFLLQHLDGRYDNEIVISTCVVNAILDRSQQKLLAEVPSRPLSPGGLAVNGKGNAIGIICRNSPSRSGSIPERGEGGLTEILPLRYFAHLIAKPPQPVIQKEGSGKSWLGVQTQILTRDMAEYWGLNNAHGLLINYVIPRSPAEKAKLQMGDIITSIENFQIVNDDEKTEDLFRDYIRSLPEGTITIQVLRDYQPLVISAYLESTPKSQFLAEESFDDNLGVSVKELTQDLILDNDLEFDTEGVWVSRVEEAGAAGLAGLEVNDLILSIDSTKIRNPVDFESVIHSLEKRRPEYIQVFVRREQITQFIFIKIPSAANQVED
jgi:serine protease Do